MKHIEWSEIEVPGHFFHVASTRYKPDTRFKMHNHGFAELMLVESGAAIQIMNGVHQSLRPGSLYFIRPGDCHALHAGPEGMFLLNCAFPFDRASSLESRYFERNTGFFVSNAPMPRTILLREPDLSRACALFHGLFSQNHDRFALDHLLMTLYGLANSDRPGTKSSSAPPWLREACDVVEEAPDLRNGTALLFSVAGRSPEHVAREMRKTMGQSPSEFVAATRLSRAARLLRTTDLAILEVLLESGFENPSWFHRSFKKRYRVTPLQYRKASRYQAHQLLS